MLKKEDIRNTDVYLLFFTLKAKQTFVERKMTLGKYMFYVLILLIFYQFVSNCT